MFFDKSWSDVSEDEINNLSNKLSEEMGGWIFHSKIDFSAKTPHIRIDREHPEVVKGWVQRNK